MAPFKARTLVVDGHMFLKEKDYKSKIYWKCRKFSKFGCRCRLLTTSNRIVLKMHGQHNHPIDEVQLAEVMGDQERYSSELIMKNSKNIKLEPLEDDQSMAQMILENLPVNSNNNINNTTSNNNNSNIGSSSKPLSVVRSVLNSHSGLKLTLKRSGSSGTPTTILNNSSLSDKKFKLITGYSSITNMANQQINESNIRKFTSWSILKQLKPSFQCNIKQFMVLHSENDVLILTRKDEVYSYGKNESGLLGVGNTKPVTEPVEICELWGKEIVEMAHGGFHVLALTRSGHIFCWGNNDDGQLGNGTNQARYKPKLLMDQKFTSIKCGDYHNLALTDTGEVYAWGYNDYGQIGIGNNDHQMIPQKVFELDRLTCTAIACGGHHSLALTSEGQVYAWGINYCGQLGIGNFDDQTLPVRVELPDSDPDCATPIVIQQIAAGNWHTLLLSQEGIIWTFGGNKLGQHRTCIPVKVNVNVGLVRFKAISANHSLSVALSEGSGGFCYVWGELMNVTDPVQVPHKTELTSIDEAIGVYSTVRSTPHLISIGTFDYQTNSKFRPSLSSSTTIKVNQISQLKLQQQQPTGSSSSILTATNTSPMKSNNNQITVVSSSTNSSQPKHPPPSFQSVTTASSNNNKFRTILPKPASSGNSPIIAIVNNHHNNTESQNESQLNSPSSSPIASQNNVVRPLKPAGNNSLNSPPQSSAVKFLLIQPSTTNCSPTISVRQTNGSVATNNSSSSSSSASSSTPASATLTTYQSRAKSSISALFNKPERSDFKFKIEGKIIYAHRWYLQIASPYFDRKLSSDGEWSNYDTVDITDYSYAVFYRYIRFLYTDSFLQNSDKSDSSTMNFPNAMADFLLLAIDFNESELVKRSIDQLSSTITIENCCLLYELSAKSDGLLAFRQAVTRYIFANYKNVCLTDAYKAMDSGNFKSLVLSLEELKRNKSQQRIGR